MRAWPAALFVLAVLVTAGVAPAPSFAVQPDEVLSDPALEARARALSAELRCLVCQNQSIDDSDAPLARDLRLLVRDRLKAGDSDAEVLDFVVARYGEFVLMRPRLAPHTLLLWLTPPLVLALAGALLLRTYRRRRRAVADAGEPLSPDEQRRLAKLLDQG